MENITTKNLFKENFNYSSFFLLLIFSIGIYILFLILKNDYGNAFLYMLGTFIIYIIHNIINNLKENFSIFNDFLEDLVGFFTFEINIIIFGMIFYNGKKIIVLTIIFFAICSVLSSARSWILKQKNSIGFPIALNGLFFPLTYYIYIFYLQSPGSSIFIIYFIIIGLLSISKHNFIQFEEHIEKKILKFENKNNYDKINNNENKKDIEDIEDIEDINKNQSRKEYYEELKNNLQNKNSIEKEKNIEINKNNINEKINFFKKFLTKNKKVEINNNNNNFKNINNLNSDLKITEINKDNNKNINEKKPEPTYLEDEYINDLDDIYLKKDELIFEKIEKDKD